MGSDDDEEYEEANGGSRMLGFMFGNVDDSGELEVDYLDEDAKERIDALANDLGSSLIDLSGRSLKTPAATGAAVDEDYDEKAEDAVNYEDIEEQYEGPETATEEDHLMPKSDFLSVDISSTFIPPVFDDENYDDDEEEDDKNTERVAQESEAGTLTLTEFTSNAEDRDDLELVHNHSFNQEIAISVEQPGSNLPIFDGEIFSGASQTDISPGFAGLLEEEPSCSEDITDVRSTAPLPILCEENGMAVLRFSEIFGVSEPLKKAAGREHKYSVSKDKYTSLDVSIVDEDDDEAFLRGSCQIFSTRKPSAEASAEDNTLLRGDLEFDTFERFSGVCDFRDERKDSCLSAEPLRKDSAFDFSVEWQSSVASEFYSLDQQDWEDRIVWANSPAMIENSVESCELSGPDAEVVAREEREITSKSDYQCSNEKSIVDEKDSRSHIALSASSVEPFSSGFSSTLTNSLCSKSLHHPQLLRLESRLGMSSLNHSSRKEPASEGQNLDSMKRFKQLTLQNKDLMEGSWIENIIWESEKPISKSKLILDLQDEHMVFEILDNKEYEHLRAHAGAVITSRTGKTTSDAFGIPGHVASSGGLLSIANDKFYSDRRTSPQLKSLSKKRVPHGVKILHSIPALMLQTMKPKLSNKEVANFHRPKALWYPHDNELAVKELAKLPTKGPMKVILKSLGSKGSKIYVDAEETVSSFKAKASKKHDFSLTEAVKIYYLGKELEDEKTFSELNVLPNSLLHLVRTKIHLLPMAHMLPSEKKSLRPPGAFKKKSDISARDGHVFLMEYCEERPLLLGNPGMGARLYTYYQKSSPDDQNGDLLRNSNSDLGTVVTLDPADKSPFLGDIIPGCSQSSLETEMYKAPVFRHRVASNDYLLVRSSKGKLSIRRIDKIHVVGQQEPLVEVMSPGSKNPQNYLWNRLLVYIYREFRAAQKRSLPPSVRAADLSAQFPQIAEHFLRKRLKHCADLQKGPNGRLLWVMRRNFHIPQEEELRKMVKPETVCSYESMQACLYRLKRLGISRLAHLTSPTQLAALSSAINQLPDEAIALAAASHIEREMQITPWNLSANFIACIGQDKGNVERLEISGVGDPSGRGLGFSYVRAASKPQMTNAMAKKKPVVARGTTVTGTDADLRRLSMGAAREVLLKFNVSEEHIGTLSRWHRIALIRKLSSEQAEAGVKVDPTTISKFARGQRMSFLQLQQQNREKCQEIWDRQLHSLSAVDNSENESDSEAHSDLDSFAGDLENLLDAEEGDEGDEGTLEMKSCKSDVVKGLKMKRHPPQARHEEMEDEAAEAVELCRMLMDGDEGKWKKKKKLRPPGEAAGLIQGAQRTLVAVNAPQLMVPSTMVKQTDGTAVQNDVSSSKKNNGLMEADKLNPKKAMPKKVKVGKKNEQVPLDLLNKKVKIMTDGSMGLSTRKSARESFVCGACGQLGHMRTNKFCPKYREDPEAQMNNTDIEIEAPKPTCSQDLSQSQQKVPVKKLIPNIRENGPPAEDTEDGKSALKTKILKVRYSSGDKASDIVASAPLMNLEQPSTSQPEVGTKTAPKVIKIVSNKTKPDDLQVDSQKLNVVIRPPSDKKEPLQKRITIKQPKKEIINLEQTSEDGADFDYRKTKKMIELNGASSSRLQQSLPLGEVASVKIKVSRGMWEEEEEKRRNAERIKEEQARRLFEEMSMREEQEKLTELRRYEEDIRREKEEEEFHKANKKMKIKKRESEIRSDYYDEFQAKRNNRTMPGRNRSAKRKPNAELGRYEVGYVPASKRRRGGEVGLANILEEIVELLKGRIEVSYLFQKPVSKKEAPDYLDFVKYPMDLATIKEKVRRLEYKHRDEFRRDVWQIAYNAHVYNDNRNPSIPPLADQLLEICDYLIDERADRFEEAEAGISE